MPSEYNRIDRERYVGGETGWIHECEIPAHAASPEELRRALRDISDAEAVALARLYTSGPGAFLRERERALRWNRRRERALWAALARKGAR